MTLTLDRNRAKARRGLRDALESLRYSPVHPDDGVQDWLDPDLYSANPTRRGRARYRAGNDRTTLAEELSQVRQLLASGFHEDAARKMLASLVGPEKVASMTARLVRELLAGTAAVQLPSGESGHHEPPPGLRELLVAELVIAPGAPSRARLLMA